MMVEDLMKRHFKAIQQRGKITDKTRISDFISKMMEEDHEMFNELIQYRNGPNNENEMIQEIWDSIMVRINLLQTLQIDLELSLLKNVQTQENRVINLKETKPWKQN